MRKIHLSAVLAVLAIAPLRAELLYNKFLIPSFYGAPNTEYSEWDIFYVARGAANYPDIAAPNGIRQTRSAAGFPTNSGYSPADPLAYWNLANPTITQTNTTAGAFIISPGVTGNIYSPSGTTRFEVADSTAYVSNIVSFQFQTEGTLADFANIRLIYNDGTSDISLAATDYIREYQSSGAGFGGYGNRSALQWDLTGRNITSYKIVLQAESSSMSFQQAVLDTSNTFAAVVPAGHTWNASGIGNWSDGSKWLEGSTSVENGNVKFANTTTANISLDGDHTIGELIFNRTADVSINASTLTANTGITTTSGATGNYTVNSNWKMGSFNIFDLAAGNTKLTGVVSGNYGLAKIGAGTLTLSGNNKFTEGIGVEAGILRLEGSNTYTGTTTVLFGSLVVAVDAGATGALGNSTTSITVGASNATFTDAGIPAELLIDGDHTISRDIFLEQGPFEKRLGGQNTNSGALFSGNVNLSATTTSNVHFTAKNAGDNVTFSGAITGGAATSSLIKDGTGTVIFSGSGKDYNNATTIAAGTLKISTGFTGNGDVIVSSGARLVVDGSLGGNGNLAINSGIIGGSGTVGRAFTLDFGDRLSPGNSPGTFNSVSETWAGGGGYLWEINDVDAGVGTGWDVVHITGTLSLTATSATPFILSLSTLTLANIAGSIHDLQSGTNYLWKIATASGGITGFNSSQFSIDTTNFTGLNGNFTVTQTGNDLSLAYLAVIPEPSSYLLIVGGAIFLCLIRKNSTTNP